MNNFNRGRCSCQDESIFHGSIPTTHNHHMFGFVKVTIAGGTRTDTTTPQFLFSRNIQPIRFCTRRNNNTVRWNDNWCSSRIIKFLLCRYTKRSFGSINLSYDRMFKDGTIGRCLSFHSQHHFWSQPFLRWRKDSRKVFYNNPLALQLTTDGGCNDHRFQSGSGGINGSRQSCWTAANNHDAFWKIRNSRIEGKEFFFFFIIIVVFFVSLALFQFFQQLFFCSKMQVWSALVVVRWSRSTTR
mmetsp:Transcript_35446/g.52750  ORF Transcript_35446/g.52750 Transcript_35446/m.52750 type:complete len:242 (-) Transcript_35446:782-1507(-)